VLYYSSRSALKTENLRFFVWLRARAKKVVHNTREVVASGVWPPPNSKENRKSEETFLTIKENPDSQKSSPIKLLILKKCSFASSAARFRLSGFWPKVPPPRSLVAGVGGSLEWSSMTSDDSAPLKLATAAL
jgi:hypothetical protein